MKRGLLITLVTVAIALLCGNVFAYAPIIKDMPEVWIGDEEDNAGLTVDINFFRFTAAFNFDDYVTFDPDDPNPVTTDVRWSFMTDLSDPNRLDLLLINGKVTVDDPYTEAPEPGAKELTDRTDNSPVPRASANADFWDIWDSDPATGPPWTEPVPGNELNTIITIMASNGSKYTCEDVLVRARLGAVDPDYDMPDKLSQGVEVLAVWDQPALDGFVAGPQGADDTEIIPGSGIYVGTHGTSGDSVSAGPGATHPSNQFYVIWDAPANEVAYAPGYVYRIKYTIRNTQSDVTKCPKVRLLTEFVGTGILAYSGGIMIGGANVNRLFGPSPTATTYNAYVEPPLNLAAGGVTNIKPRFEVYAFSNDEVGVTTYLDEVIVERFATPSKASGNLITTYSPSAGWTGWSSETISPPFGGGTVGSDGTGLYLETPMAVGTALNYARWTRPGDGSPIQFTADKLYRCVYTLQSSVTTTGQIRGLNGNKGTDWISKFVIIVNQTQVHVPSASGTEYSNWYETMPEFHTVDTTLNNMYFDCDVADASASQGGRFYITKVELYWYNIP